MNGPPTTLAPAPAGSPAPAPAPAAASTTPGGRIASTDDSAMVGSPCALSGLMASVVEGDYDSDPEFCWAGNEEGVDYSVGSTPCKSNDRFALYLSGSHSAVLAYSPTLPSLEFSSPSASSTRRDSSVIRSDLPPSISLTLQSLLSRLSQSSIAPDPGCHLAVTDSGATDHIMFPDKSAFISYKTTSHLKVCMGNNTYLAGLARGSAIISLNGQRVLVRNALHVPGLAVPLYPFSVQTHTYGTLHFHPCQKLQQLHRLTPVRSILALLSLTLTLKKSSIGGKQYLDNL